MKIGQSDHVACNNNASFGEYFMATGDGVTKRPLFSAASMIDKIDDERV